MDSIILDAENKALREEVERLRRKTRTFESQDFIREAESAADFTAGQMDRVVHNVRNVNYGLDKLESGIDIVRRDRVLLHRTEGLELPPNREAVSVIYLSMDHFRRKHDKIR